jgi:hypothetical protein
MRPSLTLFEVAHFRNREAMAACSRVRKPTVEREKMILSREAAAAHIARPNAVAASRLLSLVFIYIFGLTGAASCFLHLFPNTVIFKKRKRGNR